jgi:hypothetical protein
MIHREWPKVGKLRPIPIGLMFFVSKKLRNRVSASSKQKTLPFQEGGVVHSEVPSGFEPL